MAKVSEYLLYVSPQVCLRLYRSTVALRLLCWLVGWKLKKTDDGAPWGLSVWARGSEPLDVLSMFGMDPVSASVGSPVLKLAEEVPESPPIQE